MKRVLLVLALSVPFSFSSHAQEAQVIPPFKYVSVETIDYSGVKDMFQVSLFARKWFTYEGYEIVADTPKFWSPDVKKDSCSVLVAKLLTHERIKGKYHTTLYMVDCNQDTVYQSDGKAMGSTAPQGFQYAAAEAMKLFKKDLIEATKQAEKGQKEKN